MNSGNDSMFRAFANSASAFARAMEIADEAISTIRPVFERDNEINARAARIVQATSGLIFDIDKPDSVLTAIHSWPVDDFLHPSVPTSIRNLFSGALVDYVRMKNERNGYANERGEYEKKYNRLSAANERLEADLAKQHGKINELDDENENLRIDLEQARKCISELVDKKDALEEKLRSYEDDDDRPINAAGGGSQDSAFSVAVAEPSPSPPFRVKTREESDRISKPVPFIPITQDKIDEMRKAVAGKPDPEDDPFEKPKQNPFIPKGKAL